MKTKAFIFDLDGVIVDTAKYHYLAWKKLANNLNIDFTHEHNELLKGVSRVRSLEIILGLGNVEASDEQKNEWYTHWVKVGFDALEAQLVHSNGRFCFGDYPTIADCCLIPQVYNALRFNIDLSAYPKIQSIYTHCNTLSAFQNAAPEAQADAA